MKLLLDSCIDRRAQPELQAAGHDVDWVGNWPADPGDAAILAHAHQQDRVLVTLDKDFGELAVVHGHVHKGIIRLVRIMARQQGSECVRVCQMYMADLLAGAIITVDPKHIRVRLTSKDYNGRE
ncbi:MAG: DUF5615 family PIN-like protein [Chloroflexota bacterium]|nr:DUF5615 family PIN-like protein [Chloroflexota bacterium]